MLRWHDLLPIHYNNESALTHILHKLASPPAEIQAAPMSHARVSKYSRTEKASVHFYGQMPRMCPDCGNRFGLETGGGNGFCVDCAWKH